MRSTAATGGLWDGMPSRGPLAQVRRFPVTAALAAAMLGVYGLQLALGGSDEAAVRLGALRADRAMEHHELYRLFAAAWLHHGPIHLLFDVAAFAQLASLVEFVWGGKRLFVIYLATGLVGALAAVALGPWGVPAYGASAGVLGLAGLLMASRWVGEPTLRLFLQEALGRRLTVAVFFTFAVGLVLEVSLPDVVSGWAHLGGFVAGTVLAFSVQEQRAGRELYTLLAGLMAAALTVSAGAVAWHGDRALATHHHDMAQVLLARVSADPGSYAAYLDLLPMYDHFVAAGERDEGLVRFAEQVGQLTSPALLSSMAGRLYLDADAGEPKPEALQAVLERWLELEPHDPFALNAMAWHLVTRPDEAHRDPARAVELAAKSLRRVPDQFDFSMPERVAMLVVGGEAPSPRAVRASNLDTLAEALLQVGRVDEALEVQRESVQIATELELSELEEMQRRLERIEAAGG